MPPSSLSLLLEQALSLMPKDKMDTRIMNVSMHTYT